MAPRTNFWPTVVAALLVATGGPTRAESKTRPAEDKTRTVSVTGEGRVQAVPDLAALVFAVQTTGETADGAVRRNAQRAADVVAALKQRIGPSDEIQTTAIEVEPRFERRKAGSPEIAGYVARNEVQVRTGRLDRLGEMIDAAIAAGANEIRQLRFDLADPEPTHLEALRRASRHAENRARAVAEALGLKLGPVQRVVIGGAPAPVPRFVAHVRTAEAATPVEPGTLEVRASVQVEYRIE